jgi:hypothetical protein
MMQGLYPGFKAYRVAQRLRFGALTGSAIGFAALVAGALFNAKLNRDRDDRLRRFDTRAVAAAIRAELASVEETLRENAQGLRKNAPMDFVVPDIAHSVRMFPGLSGRIGLLGDTPIITEVVGVYIVIDQYCEAMLMAGGTLGGTYLSIIELLRCPRSASLRRTNE